LFPAAGQNLVRIGLMPDIPDQTVFRGVIDVVQGDGQLDYAESGAEMPAGLADAPEQKQAQLVRQLRQLRQIQCRQLGGAVDAVQQRGTGALAGYLVESTRHLTRALSAARGSGNKRAV